MDRLEKKMMKAFKKLSDEKQDNGASGEQDESEEQYDSEEQDD